MRRGIPYNYSSMTIPEYERHLDDANIDEQVSSGRWYSKHYYGTHTNIDPGRMRDEVFFKAMYGRSPAEVRRNLTKIIWMPGVSNKQIWFSTVNSAHKKLQMVSNELVKLPKKYHKYVSITAGTYNWRNISGTNRLSAHSFGIAIDINTSFSNYWKWDFTATGKIKYRNRIPQEIVDIFEKHGFVWGGRWYHYDTMHFEFRPEIAYFLETY